MVEGWTKATAALDGATEGLLSMSRGPGWLCAFRRLRCGRLSGELRLRCRPGSPREAVIGFQGGDEARTAG
jgi:hypothetical protein